MPNWIIYITTTICICTIIFKIKDIVLLLKSTYAWLKRQQADRRLKKSTDNYLQTINNEIGGVEKEMPVTFIPPSSDLISEVRRKEKAYSIAPILPERFSWKYIKSWEDLEAKVLIKGVESKIYTKTKELLPLDVVCAFELFVAYRAATLQGKSGVARKIREELDAIEKLPNLTKVKDWYEIFEKLHVRGCLRGVVLPLLEEMYNTYEPDITDELRKECADFLVYTRHWSVTPPRIEIQPFLGDYIKCRIVPIFEENWKYYSQTAIEIPACNYIFFASSQRHGFKAVEAAMGAKLLAPKFKFGILRFTICLTRLIEKPREKLVYTYLLISPNVEILEKARKNEVLAKRDDFIRKNKLVIIKEANQKIAINKAIKILREYHEVWIENDKKGWNYLSDVIFEVIHKTGVDISNWGFEQEGYIKAMIILKSKQKFNP